MKIFLHDATTLLDMKVSPQTLEPLHGERGPTHCGTLEVDYPYQVEMWVKEIDQLYPRVTRIECPSLGREWRRDTTGIFREGAFSNEGS